MEARKDDRLGKIFLGILGVFVLVKLMGSMWTLFILLPGAAFLYAAMTAEDHDKDRLKLIYPGAVITGTGLILLYQSLTGHWGSWAYVWALYPVFVGLAMKWYGERRDKPKKIAKGEALARGWMIGFAALCLLFEIVIFNFWSFFWLAVVAWGVWAIMGKKGGKHWTFEHRSHDSYEKRKNDDIPKRKNDDIVIV